ncbi:hypothetical protein TRVL_03078 [Trypanosoma vivax]|nr:hypothetical protein TRVL_03078 [Trypanosoma vivax]
MSDTNLSGCIPKSDITGGSDLSECTHHERSPPRTGNREVVWREARRALSPPLDLRSGHSTCSDGSTTSATITVVGADEMMDDQLTCSPRNIADPLLAINREDLVHDTTTYLEESTDREKFGEHGMGHNLEGESVQHALIAGTGLALASPKRSLSFSYALKRLRGSYRKSWYRDANTAMEAEADCFLRSFRSPENANETPQFSRFVTDQAQNNAIEMHSFSDSLDCIDREKGMGNGAAVVLGSELVNENPVKFSDGQTGLSSPVAERMKYEAPEDPRNYIINILVNSVPGTVTLQTIHDALQWDERFAEANGTVLDYLVGYQSIFAVSPLDDRVTMRQPLQKVSRRRMHQDQWGYHALSSRVGSVSCSYVAYAFDLEAMAVIYKRRGYTATIIYDALHVSSFHIFDLFLFPNGVVVWWGMNRCDHWLVEDDFLSPCQSFVGEGVRERHSQKNIDELYPFWRSYELDENCDMSTVGSRKEALERFSTNLCFDHYLIPSAEPLRSQVMLTVSEAMGRNAVVDFFDSMTQKSQKEVLSIPSEISGFFDYFSARRQIARLEGELHLAIMTITALADTPDFLWEMAWLYDYHELAVRQNSSEQLFSWFIAKSDALLQQLANIKTRRHRLFMLGSDVALILLLMVDVVFIMSLLVLKLYFPIEE